MLGAETGGDGVFGCDACEHRYALLDGKLVLSNTRSKPRVGTKSPVLALAMAEGSRGEHRNGADFV